MTEKNRIQQSNVKKITLSNEDGVDFTDSFAPVATDTSIRVVFAITRHKKTWTLKVIDVEASFLEGDLEEDI